MPRDIRRLRRLAEHRSRIERIQELKLASARRATLDRLAALQDSRGRLDAMLALGNASHGEADPTLLNAGSGYLVRMGREINARTAALQHVSAIENEERQAVLNRRRDRRAMESLLERELARAAQELRRAEGAALDEHASTSWWRRQQ